ncbi:hypothetical protein ACHQM5_019809 [Ranunculus cassubicifolius]
MESRTSNSSFTPLRWCLPVLKVTLICEVQTSLQQSDVYDNSMKLCSILFIGFTPLFEVVSGLSSWKGVACFLYCLQRIGFLR